MQTVLIVDDSKEVRFFLTKIFEDQGLKVSVAEDGKQGIEAYKKCQHDIVFSDIEMPVMGGIEFAKFLFDKYDIKISLMTGSPIKNLPEEYFFAPGVKNILHKSIFVENLVPILNSIIKHESRELQISWTHTTTSNIES